MNSMNWSSAYPELFLLVMACVITLIDLWVKSPRRGLTYVLSLGTLATVAGMHLAYLHNGINQFALQRMMVSDPISHFLGFCASLAVLVTLVYSQSYARDRDILKGELFSLSLFSMLGMSIMMSANNLLVVYLGLELMSLSLYALVALRREDQKATEAAMKYFILGAIASGFLLYGMSMLYGATGSLDHEQIYSIIGAGAPNKLTIIFASVFIVSGLAFKLGAVPFHMWVPDVYEGAPTAATLLVAAAPKIATFAMVLRLLIDAMSGLAVEWQQMLLVLAISSLVLGNLAAIAQTNLKRMLAYSTIAQIGFMLLGLTVFVSHNNTVSALPALSSAMFYIVTYVFTTLGAFGLIMLLATKGFESEQIKDLAGLHHRSPLLAAVMAVFMFSMAGLPPTVGFYAKLAILQTLITTASAFNVTVAVVAVLLSLIGAFYYLRVIKVMYFDEPRDTTPLKTTGAPEAKLLLVINALAVLVFGLLPNGLMQICTDVIKLAFKS